MKDLRFLLVVFIVIFTFSILFSGCAAEEMVGHEELDSEEYDDDTSQTISYSIYIKLVVEEDGMPTMLNVLEGEYQLRNGLTLWEGSSVQYEKDNMSFPQGLLIEIVGGEVEIRGTIYADGTKILVDNKGNLKIID